MIGNVNTYTQMQMADALTQPNTAAAAWQQYAVCRWYGNGQMMGQMMNGNMQNNAQQNQQLHFKWYCAEVLSELWNTDKWYKILLKLRYKVDLNKLR